MMRNLKPLILGICIGMVPGWAFSATGPRPIQCTDNFLPAAEVRATENFRAELETRSELKASRKNASSAVSDALADAFRDIEFDGDVKAMFQSVHALVDNAVFDEALARSFSLSGLKKGSTIADFQSKLKSAPIELQLKFADLVVNNYRILLKQAFAWVDEDRLAQLAKRWALSEDDAFRLLSRWTAGETTAQAELRLGVLTWAKVISPGELLQDMRRLGKKSKDMKISDREDILLTRIKSPHSERDLARNRGPISNSEFSWRIKYWNFLGWGRHKLNLVRYPRESSFVLALSVLPVTFVHAFSKDWNLTNTVATIIGGVATCPPLIAQLTREVIRQQHEAVWIEVLTLKQLSEVRRWTLNHPKRAEELGILGLTKDIDERIEELRRLRYDGDAL